MLPGQLNEIHNSAADQFLIKGSKWFTVNYPYASKLLKDVTENYKNYLPNARKQATFSKQEFNLHKMSEKFCELVDKGLEGVPQQTTLKLPKLKKVGETEAPKLKLPKLKKVEV